VPIFDFVGTSVSIRPGGEIRLPTVRAFFRALQVFGPEIETVRAAIRQSPDKGLRAEIAVAPFIAGLEDKRLIYVFEGLADAKRFRTEEDARNIVLGYVALLAPHFDALDELLTPSAEDEPRGADEVDPGAQRIFALAERIGIDPMTIVDWPLGVFLDALKHFSSKAGHATEVQEQRGPLPPGIGLDIAGFPGQPGG
jgi:hypothetical protein